MTRVRSSSNASGFHAKAKAAYKRGRDAARTYRIEVDRLVKSTFQRLRERLTAPNRHSGQPHSYGPADPSSKPAVRRPEEKYSQENIYETPKQPGRAFSPFQNHAPINEASDTTNAEDYEENIYEQIDDYDSGYESIDDDYASPYQKVEEPVINSRFGKVGANSLPPKLPSTPPPARPKDDNFQAEPKAPAVPPHRQKTAADSEIYDEVYEPKAAIYDKVYEPIYNEVYEPIYDEVYQPISGGAPADRQAAKDQNLDILNQVIRYDTRLLKAVQNLSSRGSNEEQKWSNVIKNAEATIQNWQQTAQKRKSLPDGLFNAATTQLISAEKALLQVYKSLSLAGIGPRNAADKNASQTFLKPQAEELRASEAREQKGGKKADEFVEITRL